MIIWSPRAPSIILLNFALLMKSSPLALLARNTSLAFPILPICLPNLSLLPRIKDDEDNSNLKLELSGDLVATGQLDHKNMFRLNQPLEEKTSKVKKEKKVSFRFNEPIKESSRKTLAVENKCKYGHTMNGDECAI